MDALSFVIIRAIFTRLKPLNTLYSKAGVKHMNLQPNLSEDEEAQAAALINEPAFFCYFLGATGTTINSTVKRLNKLGTYSRVR